MNFPKILIIIGFVIIATGIILYIFPQVFNWVGKLPGDIRMEKENSKNGYRVHVSFTDEYYNVRSEKIIRQHEYT